MMGIRETCMHRVTETEISNQELALLFNAALAAGHSRAMSDANPITNLFPQTDDNYSND